MSISFLEKRGYAIQKPESLDSRFKTVRLAGRGQNARETYIRLNEQIENGWSKRFGQQAIKSLRSKSLSAHPLASNRHCSAAWNHTRTTGAPRSANPKCSHITRWCCIAADTGRQLMTTITRRNFCAVASSALALQPLLAQSTQLACDVAIIGGGTGGFAAALAAFRAGMRVVLTEETDWIGGQLTAQAVPPTSTRGLKSSALPVVTATTELPFAIITAAITR